ncbi:unnamed protein product, partial [Rotaria sordida]
SSIVERMPVLMNNQPSTTNNEEQTYEQEDSSSITGINSHITSDIKNEPVEDLFKILDEPSSTNTGNEFNTENNLFDLLNSNNQQSISVPNPLDDIFGNDLLKNQSIIINGKTSSIPSMTAIDKNGLRIIFQFERQDNILFIHLHATNSTKIPITNFVFKAAVPKTFNLELLPPTSTIIPSNNSGDLRQTIKILNSNKDKLRMRIKLNYLYNNSSISDEAELNTFPEQCYN